MDIFKEFRTPSNIRYPPFALKSFEIYFFEYMQHNEAKKDKYIPVFWTENQISKNWNECKIKRQQAVETLAKDKKYFAVVQHADGIIDTKLPGTIIFSMGGKGNIPLPLTYENPDLFDKYKDTPKTIFCSFVGALTHGTRRDMCSVLSNKPDVIIKTPKWRKHVAVDDQKTFLDITSKSRFTLAPRGYGKTSFRLYEALHLKSIPVYIHTDIWLPYTEIIDWKKMAIIIHRWQLPKLYDILKNITDEEVVNMQNYYEQHKKLFTYEGMSDYILQKVSDL